jgi:histidine phosphotransferase ChpT
MTIHSISPPPRAGAAIAADPGEAGQLCALIGSRICHDLVNPVGAIANGVELLQLGGAAPGSAELALVADSVAETAARLRFFRIAFGQAAPGQSLDAAEAREILAGCHAGGRLTVAWELPGSCPRGEAQVAFLLLQCVETALPRGGEVRIAAEDGGWRIEASGPRLAADPSVWELLQGGTVPAALRPGEVQFALAPRAAAALGRRLSATLSDDRIAIVF